MNIAKKNLQFSYSFYLKETAGSGWHLWREERSWRWHSRSTSFIGNLNRLFHWIRINIPSFREMTTNSGRHIKLNFNTDASFMQIGYRVNIRNESPNRIMTSAWMLKICMRLDSLCRIQFLHICLYTWEVGGASVASKH